MNKSTKAPWKAGRITQQLALTLAACGFGKRTIAIYADDPKSDTNKRFIALLPTNKGRVTQEDIDNAILILDARNKGFTAADVEEAFQRGFLHGSNKWKSKADRKDTQLAAMRKANSNLRSARKALLHTIAAAKRVLLEEQWDLVFFAPKVKRMRSTKKEESS